MISTADIQIASRGSGLRLTPLASEFLAVLFNAAIYEGGRGDPLQSNERIMNFLWADFPKLLAGASESLKIRGEFSAIDAIHWLIPRFPDQISGNPQLAFIFDKE